MKNPVVIGAQGMVGRELVRTFGGLGLGRSDCDLTRSTEHIRRVLAPLQPTIVINAAAMTDVDACEIRQDEAFAVNGHGPAKLAEVCSDLGATLVHISSDYVFDGQKQAPYVTADDPRPLSVYGQSKRQGEQGVEASCPRHFIIRTAWLFGDGPNFVRWIHEKCRRGEPLYVVFDQIGSPTYTVDLAQGIHRLVQAEHAYGTYHVVNEGTCSRLEIAREVVRLIQHDVDPAPISWKSLPHRARRPVNSALHGCHLRPWHEALRVYVKHLRGLPIVEEATKHEAI